MKYFIYVPLRHEEIYHTVVKYSGQHLHQYGLMRRWWKEPENIQAIALAFSTEMKTIGAAMLLKRAEEFPLADVKYNFAVFVRENWRNRGVGGKLVSSLRFMADEFYCDNTTQAKINFFTKHLDGKNVR